MADYPERENVASLLLDAAAESVAATLGHWVEKPERVFAVSINLLECFYEAIYGKVGWSEKA